MPLNPQIRIHKFINIVSRMNTLLKKLFTLTTFSLALLPAQNAVHAQCKNSIDENIYKELPFNMPKVEQPSFPDYTVSILQFGAKSDGTTLNTKAINDAIKAVNAKGGGKVVIPEGLWLTGPIELLSNVNLHKSESAAGLPAFLWLNPYLTILLHLTDCY